ncbi:MAG: nicotinamidase [Nanoarchaeota archaeon]
MKKIAVLIIDAQNDFCSPNGALFVPGSEEDNKRLSQWILDNKNSIDYIGCTLDSHQINDIAHPGYWRDKNGNHPNPFTAIFADDAKSGKWSAVRAQHGIKYLQTLQDEGEYVHVIWPEHCLIGSWGHAIDEKIMNALKTWSRGGKPIHFVTKGTNTDTEHFGAFEAQVPIENAPETQYNLKLQEILENYDVVYLAGQAKSHCVANTLKQVVRKAPSLAKKFVILEDAMSDVPGGPNGPGTTPTFGELAQPIYDEARALGVRFSTTAAEKLSSKGAPATV